MLLLSGMIFVLTRSGWEGDVANIGITTAIGCILCYASPKVGWITLAYPLVLIRDAVELYKPRFKFTREGIESTKNEIIQ